MATYLALIHFTEQGLQTIAESPQRAKAFTNSARKAGAKVKQIYWTTGAFDGLIVLEAPDETTAAGLFLALSREGNVKTQMLRAFDRAELESLLGSIG